MLGKIYGEIAMEYVQPIAGGPKLLEKRLSVEIFVRAKDYGHTEGSCG